MKTDSELLAALRGGDPGVLGEILARHGAMVLRCCRRVLAERAEAEDAVQATFLVLLRRGGDLRPGTRLAAWLHGVARNVAARALRERLRRERREEAAARQRASAAGDESEWTEELERALAALSAPLREAVVLRFLEGRSQVEAARLAGCPTSTLASRTSLGLARLRERLRRRAVGVAVLPLLEREAQGVRQQVLPSTLEAALESAVRAGGATSSVLQLVEATMKAVTMKKLGWTAAGLLVALLAGAAAVPMVWTEQPAQELAETIEVERQALEALRALGYVEETTEKSPEQLHREELHRRAQQHRHAKQLAERELSLGYAGDR